MHVFSTFIKEHRPACPICPTLFCFFFTPQALDKNGLMCDLPLKVISAAKSFFAIFDK